MIKNLYGYDVELLPAKFTFFAFEFDCDSIHLLGRYSLLQDPFIKDINCAFADVNTNDLLGIRQYFSGYQACCR